jgi:hypothetical protein
LYNMEGYVMKPDEGNPLLGMHTTQLTSRVGYSTKGNFLEFRFKASPKDLVDSHLGYSRYSEVSLLTGTIRYYPLQTPKPNLQEFTFFKILSLSPIGYHLFPFSWRIDNGFFSMFPETNLSKNRDQFYYFLEYSLGLTVEPYKKNDWKNILIYMLPGVRWDYGNAILGKTRGAASIIVGISWRIRDLWSMQLEYHKRFYILNEQFPLTKVLLLNNVRLNHSFAIEAGILRYEEVKNTEMTCAVKYYF